MRLYLFDMDGTLIPSYMDREKGQDYGHVELLPDRVQVLGELHARGAVLGIVTNQAGAAFGYQTEEETRAKIDRVIELVGVPMSVYVCLAHDKAKVPELKWGAGRRKPSPQMLLEAMEEHEAEPTDTVFVGDMETDREAAHWAGAYYSDAEHFFAPGTVR